MNINKKIKDKFYFKYITLFFLRDYEEKSVN